jgi:LmbE family N-acetylglucosaminyl deacetylase
MINELRLMLILAHPDDESLGNGGTVAKTSPRRGDVPSPLLGANRAGST